MSAHDKVMWSASYEPGTSFYSWVTGALETTDFTVRSECSNPYGHLDVQPSYYFDIWSKENHSFESKM